MSFPTERRPADLLIIGGGPAGIQASRMVKSAQPDWRVAVIRPEDHSIVYCALPYAIEGLFPLKRTFKEDALVTGNGTELIRGRVSSLDVDGMRVSLDDGRSLPYERLMIATGALPLIPPIPGVTKENVFTVKTAEDAQRILERLSLASVGVAEHPEERVGAARQKAVVIGSGAIGIEQAVAYAANGLEVHLVEMRCHVLPNLLDAEMAAEPLAELERLGIHVHLDRGLEALEGDSAVRRVRLSGGESVTLDPLRDFVVVAVGMTPDIGFLEAGGFEQTKDGLVVDEHMRTTVPGVWAAGDCAAGRSGIDGRPLGGKLATNAVPMAKVAARDILGQEATYPGFYNGAVTIVGALRVGGTGFTEAFARSRDLVVIPSIADTTARFPMMPEPGHVRIKLVIEQATQRIVGAQVVGTEAVAERIDLLTFAIQTGATTSDLARLSYSAQPWQTFFPARNAIVEAASAAAAGEIG